MDRLTREQAAILTVFTGVCCGPMDDAQALMKELIGREIETKDLADRKLWSIIREKVRPKFMALIPAATPLEERDKRHHLELIA
jgi:hypothetical protein